MIHTKTIDMTGQTFGKLTVLSFHGRDKHGKTEWLCKCDCGRTTITKRGYLIRGETRSCGCLATAHIARLGKANATHGLSRTPTGVSWQAMMSRCLNKNQGKTYADYGGRGIRVCEYLRATPEHLLDLIGQRPHNATIDRMDTNGHYSCGKCAECDLQSWPMNLRWATKVEQNRNQRDLHFITMNGERKCLSEWASIYGIKRTTVHSRIRYGRSGKELFEPLRQ